jgi:hypothetical protein
MYMPYALRRTSLSVNSCRDAFRSDDKAEGAADKAFSAHPPAFLPFFINCRVNFSE